MEASNKKLLFAAVGIGVLLLVNRAGQVADTIDGLTFKLGVGGAPQISGLSITFPVKVLVSNPNPVTLPLQGLAMTLHRIGKNGLSTPIAATSPNGVVVPSIQRNATTEFIVPVTTDLFTALTEVITDIRAGALGRYLLNTTIVSAGVKVALPAQTLTF
jgi:LEA14-like dessication related protein